MARIGSALSLAGLLRTLVIALAGLAGIGSDAAAQGGGLVLQRTFTGNLDVDGDGDAGLGERRVIDAAADAWEEILQAPAFLVPVELTAGACEGQIPPSEEVAFETLCMAFDQAEDPLPAAPVPDLMQNVHICTSVGGQQIPWFVDPTPREHEELVRTPGTFHWAAPAGSAASGKYDLLTCIHHELGHVLGFLTNKNAGAGCQHGPVPYTLYCLGTVAGGPTGAFYAFQPNRPFATEQPLLLAGPSGVFPSPVSHLAPQQDPLDLMNPSFKLSERRLPSVLDRKLLANAFGYTVDLKLFEEQVFEIPAMSRAGWLVLVLVLAGSGWWVLAARRRRLRPG